MSFIYRLDLHKCLQSRPIYWVRLAWRRPSLICEAMSLTAPGPCGMKTEFDFEDAPISFIVSKYWVTRTMSMTSLDVVPGTFSANASTLSLRPSTMAWRCRAIPSPARYLDSASPSALLICSIFSASAFSFAATLSLAAVYTIKWFICQRFAVTKTEKAFIIDQSVLSPAFISFIALFTCSSGSMSTIRVWTISYP